jgi:hypothetical protein
VITPNQPFITPQINKMLFIDFVFDTGLAVFLFLGTQYLYGSDVYVLILCMCTTYALLIGANAVTTWYYDTDIDSDSLLYCSLLYGSMNFITKAIQEALMHPLDEIDPVGLWLCCAVSVMPIVWYLLREKRKKII